MNYGKIHLSGRNSFENSYKELVSFFPKEKKIAPNELKEIIRMIENKK